MIYPYKLNLKTKCNPSSFQGFRQHDGDVGVIAAISPRSIYMVFKCQGLGLIVSYLADKN